MSEMEGMGEISYQPPGGSKYKLKQETKHYELDDCVIHDEGMNGIWPHQSRPGENSPQPPSFVSFKSSKLGSNKSIFFDGKKQKETLKIDSKGITWKVKEPKHPSENELKANDKSIDICRQSRMSANRSPPLSRIFFRPPSVSPICLNESRTRALRHIFEGDVDRLKTLLTLGASPEWLNTQDERGNTLLTVAALLSYTDPEKYYQISKLLLEFRADPLVKDADGWTAFDEAFSHSSIKLSSLLFDYMAGVRMKRMHEKHSESVSALSSLPDFEIHIKWSVDSSFLPLVGKLGPSDTIIIWKKGSCLRMDSTMAGYKNFSTKRRPMCKQRLNH
jgi:hypothetical protein